MKTETICRLTAYQIKRLETLAMRPACAPIFRPLFDHVVKLADYDYARANQTVGTDYSRMLRLRAGRSLAHARRVAQYPVCKTCGQPIVDGTDECSADPSHDARGAFQALREAIVSAHREAGARPCPCQASLNASR
jgi:hypothetical protein